VDTSYLNRAHWRTSTHSGGNGSCIEVARNLPGAVTVRDSKDRHGAKLIFTPGQWQRFAAQIKAGHPGTA
jgi:Domain of unknown function (DUF397)